MNAIPEEQHHPPQEEMGLKVETRSYHPFLVILFSLITLVNLAGLLLDLKFLNKNGDLIIYILNVLICIIIPMSFAIHIKGQNLLEHSSWIAIVAAIFQILIVLGVYPSTRQNPFNYLSIFLCVVNLFYLQKHPDVMKAPDLEEAVAKPRLMIPIVILTGYGVFYIIMFSILFLDIFLLHDQIGGTLDYSPIATSIVLPLFLAYGLWKRKKWAFTWALWYTGVFTIFGALTVMSSMNLIVFISAIFLGWSYIVLWRNKSVYQPKTPTKNTSTISYPADDEPDTKIPGPLVS